MSIIKQPAFIVGVPRSGTTLLAAMVSSHSQFSCGPETHCFDGLTDEIETTICAHESWPDRAVNYLFSIMHEGASVPAHYGFSRNAIADYLRGMDNNLSSIVSALPALLALQLNKNRWVDKTPDHLLHVEKIRAHFPDAPIIRIIRDPRDVALSLLNVPWGPKTFLEAIAFWHTYHTKTDSFFDRDRLSYSLHYEHLLASPETELQKLCTFLGEPFEPDMMDTSQSASYVNKTNEPWKKKVAEKVDTSRIQAWKKVVAPAEKREADAIIGGFTDERDRLSTSLKWWKVSALGIGMNACDVEFLKKTITDRNVRFWPAHACETPTGHIFTGSPDSKEWLGYGNRWKRRLRAVSIAARIVWYRVCSQLVAWPSLTNPDNREPGHCTKLLLMALGKQTAQYQAGQIATLPATQKTTGE